MPINRKSWLDLSKYSLGVGVFLSRGPCFCRKILPRAGLLTTSKDSLGVCRGDVGAWNWLMHNGNPYQWTSKLHSKIASLLSLSYIPILKNDNTKFILGWLTYTCHPMWKDIIHKSSNLRKIILWRKIPSNRFNFCPTIKNDNWEFAESNLLRIC